MNPERLFSVSRSINDNASMPSLLENSTNGIACVVLMLTMSACSLQSDYAAPSMTNPAQWSNTTPAADATTTRTEQADWWKQLHDPAIDALIEATLAANPTLDKAVARLDEARAQVRGNKADYFPALSASGSINEANSRINNSGVSAEAAAATGMLVGRSRTTSVGPALKWEIDLFGRVRSSVDAAKRRLDARTADAQSTRLSLAAQVATTVLDWRACMHSAMVDAAEIDSRGKTLELTRKKFNAGFTAPVDVASVERDFAAAQGVLIGQQETCARDVNALVELTGLDRDALLERLQQPFAANSPKDESETNTLTEFMPTPPAATPQLPATVLLAHPSVIAADREAAAAWSDIGVARADRWPKLDLSAALTGEWIRYAGSTLSLTNWSIAPGLSATLFDAGKGKANVTAAQARYRHAVADLQTAVRSTVKEVENALTAQQSAAARLMSSQQSARAAEVAFNAMQAKWDNGTASLLELEDARRQYATAKDSVITAARDRATAWVELVRASANGINSSPMQDNSR